MVAVLILFSLMAVILFFGMVGDKDANNRKNFTYGFVALVIAILAISLKMIK